MRVRHRPPADDPASTAAMRSSTNPGAAVRSLKSKSHVAPSSSVKLTTRNDGSVRGGREYLPVGSVAAVLEVATINTPLHQ